MNHNIYKQLDAWIDENFKEQVLFLQKLIKVPTDTPPGNNAPHAEYTSELLKDFGMQAEKYAIPDDVVQAYGMQSITNLIVRRKYNNNNTEEGITIALNAHGDVVPPGEGWSKEPYGGEIDDGKIYGRASAVSKSDFATFTFAVRALEAVAKPSKGAIELHFTYDEEFGGELGPGWLLKNNITKPDMMIAAGFSYEVVTAHNGCLQLEVSVNGKMAHAAIPDTGVDALQASVYILNALYAQNLKYKQIASSINGIKHPYLNVGLISGGTNTNVIPGKVIFKLDRRMIPEENPAQVESDIRNIIEQSAREYSAGITVDIRRILLANAMTPLLSNKNLVQAIQKHAKEVLGESIPAIGTPLYTDVRLYVERGIPGIIYGAGPRTVLESHAKRADERLNIEDLRRATKIIARALKDLLSS